MTIESSNRMTRWLCRPPIGRFSLNPIPENALLHCIALFPEQKDYVRPFLAKLSALLPEIDSAQENWTALAAPRPTLFGPLIWKHWKWHLLIDMTGLPQNIREIVDQARTEEVTTTAIGNHRMSAMLFLVAAPENAGPMERMQALCQIAWTLLKVGASVLVWPGGRSAWHRDRLIDIDPLSISAEHAHLFVSFDVAGPAEDRLWVRTFGMRQFGLPDLACIAANNSEDFQAADVLFNSLPPFIIKRQEALPLGDTLDLEHRKWKVTESGCSQIPCLKSDFGIQVFTRIE